MNKNRLDKCFKSSLIVLYCKDFHKARGRTGKQLHPTSLKSFLLGPPEIEVNLSIPAVSW